ncbi:ciliary microtubule-associated protein 3-like [Corticium candelabrum]|uniref:ciliary microtubule-associated protein 3-like n=1 Tax=Corticium candelabrum TaxID=121492 RepID=UPI002E275BBE|nr:ciliary microtubule-associated protein 3-like [Corticium candelabrum]
MPFGMINFSATLMRAMRILLEGMENVEHVDDILIHNITWEEHLGTLQELLRRMSGAGLTARLSKTVISAHVIDFASYRVGHGVTSLLEENLTEKIEVSSFTHESETDKQSKSKRGYSLGARTAKRFPDVNKTKGFPGPGSYQHKTTLSIAGPLAKPFGGAAVRFPEISTEANRSPGPGTYEHDVERHRKVKFVGSFGGPQMLKWKNDIPKKNAVDTIFGTRQSKIVTEQDTKKQLYREAYLSLYWS